jgi:sugar phosphate isomerase/epimerase
MRLGIGSYTYTWAIGVPGHPPGAPMTAKDLLDRARELGVGVVQFADNLPLDMLSRKELEEVDLRMGELGIYVEVGTRGIAPEHLGRYIEIALRLRSRILRVVVDRGDHRPGEDEIVEVLGGMVPQFQSAGICLAIENHDRFRVRSLARIVERIGSEHVGICLDTVNSFGALEGPEAVVDTLGPLTVNLHVKDFAIERVSHAMGFVIEGRPAGQGRLNVPWLLERLCAYGRDPNAILELWTPPGATLEETIAREADWAEESIKYLRSLIPE